jgi:DNA-binding MarR family transcriptional regulator
VSARLVQEQVAAKLAPLGISYAQAVVLVRLYQAPGGSLTQTEIIDSLALSRASGTLVLGQLEAHGLINRIHDRADARKLIISLTEASEEIEQDVHRCFHDVEQIVRRSLTGEEAETAFSVLQRMFDDILRHRNTRH